MAADGVRIPLDVHRWCGDVDDVEWSLLDALDDPVLDVGCGPGRIVAALRAAGRDALGIDTSVSAVRATIARGAHALLASVFAPLPREGRWGAVVLLDGNIGIGGDPALLLARARVLLRPGGLALVEVDPPGVPTERLTVQLTGRRGYGPAFAWARVGADAAPRLAAAAGLRSRGVEVHGDRWFAVAERL